MRTPNIPSSMRGCVLTRQPCFLATFSACSLASSEFMHGTNTDMSTSIAPQSTVIVTPSGYISPRFGTLLITLLIVVG